VAIASSLFFIVDLEEEGVLILPIPGCEHGRIRAASNNGSLRMKRLTCLLALVSLLQPAAAFAADGLKPGQMPRGEHRRLALHFSTRDDVLELFGPPADEIEVKEKKLFKWTYTSEQDVFKACRPADKQTYAFWKYETVGMDDGKYKSNGYAYIAFHADGRVCYAFATNVDF